MKMSLVLPGTIGFKIGLVLLYYLLVPHFCNRKWVQRKWCGELVLLIVKTTIVMISTKG